MPCRPILSDADGNSVVALASPATPWCRPATAAYGVSVQGRPADPWPICHAEDSWEALGSDHNDGLFVHGPTDALASVWDAVVPAALLARLDDCELDDCGPPCAARWDFPDGSTCLIVWGEEECYQVADLASIRAALPASCLHSIFGSGPDDMMAHEILGQAFNRLLPASDRFDMSNYYGDIPEAGSGGSLTPRSAAAAYLSLLDGVLTDASRDGLFGDEDGPYKTLLEIARKTLAKAP